jgi:aldose 1-epimerase
MVSAGVFRLYGLHLLFAVSAHAASSDSFKPYTICAPGINATFIGYGARLTHLYVPDKHGAQRDVVVGYDDPNQYLKDTLTNHTYFGPIVGRYANRIRNGTFTLPSTGSKEYHIVENEHGGINTLHGGSVGYDQQNWTVTASSSSSVTFSLLDPSGDQGFPGTVLTHATYTVTAGRLTCRTTSLALDSQTPIMLANHIYWNLNSFASPTVLNDTLWMPYSDRYIVVDGILIPTGALGAVSQKPVLDFTTPKPIGRDLASPAAVGTCGTNCTGYDNAFIIDRPRYSGPETPDLPFPMLSMWSNDTGIRMDVRTNQQGLQIYSCGGQDGSIPVKASQKGSGVGFVNRFGCLVIEPQGWIDGINHPEWGQGEYQIYGADTGPAVNFATYDFSTFS